MTKVVYPAKGKVADAKALKKIVKAMTDVQLVEWATKEKLTWKPNDHASINRMRIAMAIGELHFPSPPTTKKESKYKSYTTEALVAMAVASNVPVEPTDHMAILRMRTIQALRAHKVIE